LLKREYASVSVENPISLADLSPGQKLVGTVKKVTLSGAIIDVGMQVDGLLHISDLNQQHVTRASNVLQQGDDVNVWVKRLDLSSGRLSLTMVEPPKYSWNTLEPGLKTEGKVLRLERYGAFVDIGADTDGLVHISEMGQGRIGKPSDVVSEGDVVTVWIKDVDRKSRRISLTMLEPPELDIRSLKPDTLLTGKVVRIESFGAFVDIGAGRDGMIHVTEMGRGYVGNPSEIMSVGDEVQVRVLEVDARRGRISLSMKDLPAERYELVEDQDDLPSSMEVALRSAMEDEGMEFPTSRRSSDRRKKSRRRRDRVQDDIIYRTLRERYD
jgi:small subunit ribosomal protein S1